MKMFTTFIIFSSVVLLVSSAVRGHSQTTNQPKFHIEIQTTVDGEPRFTVTNLSGKTLMACTFQFSLSSQSRPQSEMDWDPIAQAGGDARRGRQEPLVPGASLTMYLPHAVDGPLPDKVEVVAGVWADGETFGQAVWLKTLLDNRASLTSAYEQAISLLQDGLNHDWTRNQYLAALNSKSNSLPINSIRRTLEASPNRDQDPRALQLAMRDLLAYFTQNLALLRQSKPPGGVSPSS